MDDNSDHQAQAKELFAYFSMVREGRFERDRGPWDRAMRLCERWMRMIDSPELTEQMIESFLDDIYAEPHPGSGWCELSYQFKRWARHRGFTAKDRTYVKP